MGRKFIALGAAIALLGFGLGSMRAQGPPGAAGGRNKGPGREGDFNRGRDRFRGLTPEDRQRFNRNAERWMQMSAEERKIMREREKLRRERIKQEAETALRDSGLRLDGEKRSQFESRYMQERTRIEHVMREQLEAKRREEVPALVERLKKEFQAQQGNTNTAATATPLPKPKN